MKELSTDVRVPFQPYFAKAMREGRKRVTSRPRRFGEEGQTFVAFECRFVIVGVQRRPLSWVRDYLWWFEGCASPDAFVRTWVTIHKRAGWTPGRPVWVHAFGRIE
jgi:hypothetical protein